MSKITQLKGIPTKIVKETLNVFATFLNVFATFLNVFATFLVQDTDTCIRKGEFPDKLKTADITPAFEKGDKNDKSKYGPASILPILSKV